MAVPATWKQIQAFQAKCPHPKRYALKINGISTECGRCGKVLRAPPAPNSTVQRG